MDGSGLERPDAGIGRYTARIVSAMTGPRGRMTIFDPPGASTQGGEELARRRLPTARLFGRHLQFPAAIRRTRANLYWSPAGQLPLGWLGLPSAITVHDLAIYRNANWFPSGQWLSTKLVVPRSIDRAQAIIAVSRSTSRDLQELFGVDPARITVIHHGVAVEDGAPLTSPRLPPLPPRFILFVGTLEPRKNVEGLLEAWAMIPGRPPLVLAGGWGWRTEAIRAKIDRLGAGVILLGSVRGPELPGLYRRAWCLVHPAWYEGFGMTPLEAMAYGTPVVCSNSSSLPEVVGDAALMVDPADVGGLSEAIRRVIEDPALHADLRRRGLLRAAEFSWGRSAEKTWRVLERLGPGARG